MTSADFIREHSWLVAAFILFIVVLFGLLRRVAKGRSGKAGRENSADRHHPDELPDLTENLRRVKIVTIFAGGCIIGFTLWAVFNSLSQ
ncbi:hypothetical protein [Aestuariispira insulae]|uniref:Uncharacterized protein n=1 Tax=Aestuariispira insulae TaxID=1461337 RepID=A0A3D9HWX3_9PROT|nr:hypothetical protein [Aestuariispira insulae]RED53987.1 hypothetical protein DFP90_101786 [Aestuariispira insulae]